MIRLDLQLFSGEKTEQATPKKRGDTRKKGQVARSQELGQAVVLLVGLFTIKILSSYYMNEFVDMFKLDLTSGLSYSLTQQSVMPFFTGLAWQIGKIVLPLMGAVLVFGLAVSYLQVGTLFTLKPLMPDLTKLNPIEGFKRMFSMRSAVEMLKSIVKILIVGFVVYNELMNDGPRVSQLGSMDILDIVSALGNLIFNVFWKATLAIFILALFDFWYQRFDYNKNLKMSKQEVKDEYKQQEGSPEIKGKIKERQRAMALRRMMADVPKADVVITNPTHFAVAIRYDGEKMESPVVLAKGLDEVAQNIKKVAREANVVLVENRPLAQTLYRTVEIGEAIPGELFQAVAEVLAYVYRLKGKV